MSTSFLQERAEALSRCSIPEGWKEESTSDGSFKFHKEIHGTPVLVSHVVLLSPYFLENIYNSLCETEFMLILVYTDVLLTDVAFVLFPEGHNG